MSVNRSNVDERRNEYRKKDIFVRTMGYMKEYRWRVAFVVLVMMVSSVILTVLPFLTRHAVDVDIAGGDMEGLVDTVLLYVALVVVWWILYVVRVHVMSRVSNGVVLRIRDEAFSNVESLGLQFFDSRPTGKILSRLVGDVSSLNNMLKQVVTSLVPNLFFLLVIVVAMFIMDPLLAAGAFTCLPVIVVGAFVIMSRTYPRWQTYRQKQSNIAGYSHELFDGIKVVQSFCAEKECRDAFERINDEVKSTWTSAVRLSDTIGIVIDVSQGIGYAMLFLVAMFLLGDGGVGVGQLIAFTSYISLFWQPIRALANMYNQLGNDLAGAGRVFELIDEKSPIREASDAEDIDCCEGCVDFEHVTFAYPDEPDVNVLEDLSFTVHKGQRIALVGPTGAGKTTIANLICRFYDPVEGRVLIDGHDVARLSNRSLRRSVVVMTQDSCLFTGTIGQNIAYGRPDASQEEIRKVCRALGIDDMICSLESGYDTTVDRARLSAGQRQLVALARTLLADPAILVLDEATSSIDTGSEILVQKGIGLLSSGRTSFIVAHRLSTIRGCDRIFVVQDRRIVEDGSHQELMERKGAYWHLYMSQFAD